MRFLETKDFPLHDTTQQSPLREWTILRYHNSSTCDTVISSKKTHCVFLVSFHLQQPSSLFVPWLPHLGRVAESSCSFVERTHYILISAKCLGQCLAHSKHGWIWGLEKHVFSQRRSIIRRCRCLSNHLCEETSINTQQSSLKALCWTDTTCWFCISSRGTVWVALGMLRSFCGTPCSLHHIQTAHPHACCMGSTVASCQYLSYPSYTTEKHAGKYDTESLLNTINCVPLPLSTCARFTVLFLEWQIRMFLF